MRVTLLFFLCFVIAYPFTEMTPSPNSINYAEAAESVYLLKPAHVLMALGPTA